MSGQSVSERRRQIVLALTTGAIVFASAWVGIELSRHGGSVAMLWLANAVLLGLLLRSDRRAWPGLVVAAFLGNLAAYWIEGDALPVAGGLAGLNMAEALLVAVPLQHRFGRALAIDDNRVQLHFLGIAALAPAVIAAGAAAFLTMTADRAFGELFLDWYAAHALGMLMVTPLALAVSGSRPATWANSAQLRESLLLLLATGAMTAAVFSQPISALFTILPLLALAAIRLPLPFVALCLAAVAGVSVSFTLAGQGPITAAPVNPNQQILLLQGFLVVAIFITMPLRAAITERDRLGGALLDSERGRRHAAEAAAEAKSRFLATMSHEIRTPMTGVLGMIELLRAEPALAERDRYFATLKQSAALLMRVLDDVLDYSKIESGNLELDSIDFDFEELARATLDLFGNAASQKGLLISMHCDCPPKSIVRGDANRVQQVMSNLISNAIKFTESGRVTIAIRSLGLEDSLTIWRVEVRDTGIGIAGDHMDRLFQPFVQAEMSTSRRFGGTGLGLAISRWLVEAMGGTMGVESRPRRGSTFWFEIPLPEGHSVEWHAPPQTLPQAIRPLDILVAEDNSVNQILIDAILRRFGHQVTLVENGRLAVEAAGGRHFDCILMDMQMPEMDGLAATRAIRASRGPCAEAPIIALTADASPERRRFYDNAGLTDFLTKPIDQLALAARLAAIAAPPENPDEEASGLPGDVPLLDTTNINQLCATIGSTQFDGLLDLLAVELDERPAIIRNAIQAGDIALVRREAHSLKGASTSIGAMALGQAAAIEVAPDLEAMGAGLKNLDRLVVRTRKAIETLLPRTSPLRDTG